MTYSEICNAALNLALSLTLVQFLGIMGVALGTLLASALTSFWYLPYILCRLLGRSLFVLLARSLFYPFVFCVMIWFLTAWLAGNNAIDSDLWTFAVKTGIHGVASVVLWLAFEAIASRLSSAEGKTA